MDVEVLMRKLAEAGTTVILKADHERYALGGDYWTLVISGGSLGAQGLVRAEEATLDECLRVGLARLMESGSGWEWVSEFLRRG